jgi:hypothetical protein
LAALGNDDTDASGGGFDGHDVPGIFGDEVNGKVIDIGFGVGGLGVNPMAKIDAVAILGTRGFTGFLT